MFKSITGTAFLALFGLMVVTAGAEAKSDCDKVSGTGQTFAVGPATFQGIASLDLNNTNVIVTVTTNLLGLRKAIKAPLEFLERNYGPSIDEQSHLASNQDSCSLPGERNPQQRSYPQSQILPVTLHRTSPLRRLIVPWMLSWPHAFS